MLANASKALSTAAPTETRPLAARRNDDPHLTLAPGTPEAGTHSLPQVLSLPPGPPLEGPDPNPEEVTTAEPH